MDIDYIVSFGLRLVEWIQIIGWDGFLYVAISIYVIWYFLFRFGKFKVLEVIDGDTVKIKGCKNARLHGIDAPEKFQKGGKESTEYLKRLVEGKWCKIQFINKCPYGRDVIKLFRKGDIQKKMVKAGQAIPYMSKDYEKYRTKVKFSNPSQFRKSN